MQNVQAKSREQQDTMQDILLSAFEQSLTEEQKFLKSILDSQIKTYPHEEVMIDLRRILKTRL
ncbi:hypothetical protein HPC37_07070 [Pasteurellaceae bacterium 20609_3]|uniref:hypothetical protein n=1 Tax=Spirabiliibacterium mucosae TaxID=28156 RepID=UPI001AAC6AF7|nr:hypothetical protein [Spirabiliibacterium mucosae]MBE2898567.1 hypothetical protein [Spirabiliibacterium mucosae]